jgi:hypothetical protein
MAKGMFAKRNADRKAQIARIAQDVTNDARRKMVAAVEAAGGNALISDEARHAIVSKYLDTCAQAKREAERQVAQ